MKPIDSLTELDPEVCDYFVNHEHYEDLNKAQKDVLNQDYLDLDSNYVVATHTGTGKTALAHIRIVAALKEGKRVVYISPFKAIAEEKKDEFDFYKKYGWRATVSTSIDEDKDKIDYSKYQIISMTFEKFDSILNNSSALNGWLRDVGLLVVDEGHMIGDRTRGAILEAALTKLLTLFGKRIKVVLLSAVLPNVQQISNWLDARYGISDWRPVDLQIGFALYDKDGKQRKQRQQQRQYYSGIATPSRFDPAPNQMIVRHGSISDVGGMTFSSTTQFSPRNRDSVLLPILEKYLPNEKIMHEVRDPVGILSKEILDSGGQVLVFTRDRRSAEALATRLAALMADHQYISLEEGEKIKGEYLSKIDSGNDKLKAAMTNGVGFHHAGLSLSARKAVEAAYKARLIKVIVCTTTLIAGVNLPATLVVFSSLYAGPDRIAKRDFLNGCGRAGRVKYEKRGIALFVSSDVDEALRFLSRPVENVESQFTEDTLAFQTLALLKRNKDAGQLQTSLEEVETFFSNSYYAACGNHIDALGYLSQLERMGLVEVHDSTSTASKGLQISFSITSLGYETIRYYLDPKTGYIISQMILAARACLLGKEMEPAAANKGQFQITVPKKFTIYSIIHAILHAKELRASRTTTSQPEEVAFVSAHQDEMIVNSSLYKTGLETYDKRKIIGTWMAIAERLEMKDIRPDTQAKFAKLYEGFGDGDFQDLQEHMEWLLSATARIARILLKKDPTEAAICRIIETLLARVEHDMVKEELVELCKVNQVGRKRSFEFSEKGITTIAQLADERNRQIVTSVVGEKLAQKIIEDAKKKLGVQLAGEQQQSALTEWQQ